MQEVSRSDRPSLSDHQHCPCVERLTAENEDLRANGSGSLRTLSQESSARNRAFILALEMVAYLFDQYENGTPCYEEPETQDGYLGRAFRLDDTSYDGILTLLKLFEPDPTASRPETWAERVAEFA